MAREIETQSITLMSALAVRGAFENGIIPAFEAESRIHVVTEWTPSTVIMSKIAAGERTDVVVVIVDSMDRLVEQDEVDPASRVELAHSRLGLAVPPGATHPDIGTVEAFTKALLAARSVAYSKGGASGIYFQKLIETLGIADAINAKATAIPAGFTAEKLLTGEADMAVQQVSELMVVPTVEIIGKFPEEVQQVTSFSAAIMRDTANRSAAERFIASLTGDKAASAYRASGVDPIID
ncbi:MAG TPA: substrate-binding domain-containing protein [Steroidobacteraceae bacterium]|nr:substrate-binding domain-containing protein [Steroidobacteraceae bacterium]